MKAKVKGSSLPISTKHCIELCNFIRNKPINKIKKQLELVLEKKLAIPAKRFNKDRAHKKGKIAAGFYPQKATKQIILLLNSLEANAQNKGMSVKELILTKAIANKASKPLKYGRQRGLQAKRTHIDFEAQELVKKAKLSKNLKASQQQQDAKKQEPKKVTATKIIDESNIRETIEKTKEKIQKWLKDNL